MSPPIVAYVRANRASPLACSLLGLATMRTAYLLLLICAACAGDDTGPVGDDAGAGDADADVDADADTDTDADGDGDGDADPPAPEQTGCRAADGRALCRLENDADWGAAERSGVAFADGVVTLDPQTFAEGRDDGGEYTGGIYFHGSLTSPPLEPGLGFDHAVPSWNAETPDGTWISIDAACRIGGSWTDWYRLGVWASGDADLARHSIDGQSDDRGRVLTDTIVLSEPADAIRLRATLLSADGHATPRLRRLAAALSDSTTLAAPDDGGAAWGTTLAVPARSQMEFPDGGEVWCSPTSTSMVMAYWAAAEDHAAWDLPVPTVVSGTWDDVYRGHGNWPFNVAYAASLGLDGVVGYFSSIADLEPWIVAGVPVVVSAAWHDGAIDAAPIANTNGHLLVVTGFAADGAVTVNDPAASSDEQVSRVYDRRQIEAAWLGGSGGITYLIFPPGHSVPW